MKKIIPIATIVLVLIVVIYFWVNRKMSVDSAGNKCLRVNRNKFKSRWNDTAIPSGTIRKIGDTYIDVGDPHSNGSAVGGFFKAVDLYPSESAGKYYQKEIRQWVLSQQGLPYWNVATGELLCEN